LRFGFDWDKHYLTEIQYLPFIGTLSIHPLILYLMFCDRRAMLAEIRIGYLLVYVRLYLFLFCLVLDEWVFSVAFRIYPLTPYAAIYCEAFLCFSMMIINSPFDFLIVRMQQMFVPAGSPAKIPKIIPS
ncbi:hypothetical protein PMAYCL1PPCAC_32069, partial [Pristionchus mayeri]